MGATPQPAAASGTDLAGVAGAAGRVLIVEDDEGASATLARMLCTVGYEVEHARSEQDVQPRLTALPFDLVVLDLGLPDPEVGLALLATLKSAPDTRFLPVLVVTGHEEGKLAALAARADDVILKPPEADEFLTRARVLTETYRAHQVLLAEHETLLRRSRFWAHDLLGLATVVQSNAEAIANLLAQGNTEGTREAVGDLKTVARRMTALADEARGARAQARPLQVERVSLADLAQEAARALRSTTHGRAIRVRGSAQVQADGALVARVLLNLLSNALRHGAGDVDVLIEQAEMEVRVEVRDRGPGIDTGVRRRVSAPVPALPPQTPEGHGVGLAFCKFVVEAHGGRLGAETLPKGGALFWFTLPTHGSGEGPTHGDSV